MSDFYKKYLEYNNGSGELPESAFRISASQFNQFMTVPYKWYREKCLGETGFLANSGSVIGTIVHGCAAAVAEGEDVDKEAIERYIDTYSNVIEYPDVDVHTVRQHYPEMVTRLINDYVLPELSTYTQVEPFVSCELAKGYFPSGSIDVIQGSMITDYKSYNGKTKPKAIPPYYRYQLLIYAYICTKNGDPIDRIRLVYINRNIDGGVSEKTGKPLKSYPPEVTVLTESITQEDLDFIESCMKLCVETHQLAVKHPEMAYLLYRDYRLKKEK